MRICADCRWFIAPTPAEIKAWEASGRYKAAGACWPMFLRQEDPRRVDACHASDEACHQNYEAAERAAPRQDVLL